MCVLPFPTIKTRIYAQSKWDVAFLLERPSMKHDQAVLRSLLALKVPQFITLYVADRESNTTTNSRFVCYADCKCVGGFSSGFSRKWQRRRREFLL